MVKTKQWCEPKCVSFLEKNNSQGWKSLLGIIEICGADCTEVVSKQDDPLNPQVGIQCAPKQIQQNKKSTVETRKAVA